MIPVNLDGVLAEIDAQLFSQGWVHLPKLIPSDWVTQLRDELLQADAQGRMVPAAVGRGDGQRIASDIRGDRTCWLDPSWPAATAYLRCMDAIRVHLNRTAFLGLAELEAHYACYPTGSFYRRHVDQHQNTRDQGHRVVSSVAYLNEADWPATAGGELVLYPVQQAPVVIWPSGGDVVLFWSDRVPHEVKPAIQQRCSIAGWFRTRDVAVC